LALEAVGPLFPAVALAGVEPEAGLERLLGRSKLAAGDVGSRLTQALSRLSLPEFGHRSMVDDTLALAWLRETHDN
jgi:hypothetical protein